MNHTLTEIMRHPGRAMLVGVCEDFALYAIQVGSTWYEYEVPMADISHTLFRRSEKRGLMMRWIRKAHESGELHPTNRMNE